MDNFTNPFASQIKAFGTQALDAQKQITDWQLGQVKMAEKHVVSAMELSRAGFEANVSAVRAMSKTMVDAMAPAEAPKAE